MRQILLSLILPFRKNRKRKFQLILVSQEARKNFPEPHPAIQEKSEQEVTADLGFLRLGKIFFSQVNLVV